MSAPRARPSLLDRLATIGVALTGGAAVACGGVATDYIRVGSDGGGAETRPPNAQLAIEGGADRVVETGTDAVVAVDANGSSDAGADLNVPAGQCELGMNTMYPPADCSGPSDYWLATPYRPDRDITVQRIEIHTMSGSVALLANGGTGPGALLFTGAVGTRSSPEWLGTNVTSPVSLKGGELYYVAFVGGYCSETVAGPEPVEFGASSLDGPWTVTGTDNWTARFIGTCQ